MGAQITQQNSDGSVVMMVNGQIVTLPSQQDAMALQQALGGSGSGANAAGTMVNLGADGWDLLTSWKNKQTARMLQRDNARLQQTAAGFFQSAADAAADPNTFQPGSSLTRYAQGMLNLTATQGFMQDNVRDMEGLFADSEADRALSAGARVVGDMITGNVLGSGNAMAGGGAPMIAAAGLAAVALANNDDRGGGWGYGGRGYGPGTTPNGYPLPGYGGFERRRWI